MFPDLHTVIAQMPDTRLVRHAPGLDEATVRARLRAANTPVHPVFLSLYTQINGFAIEREDIELVVSGLDELLSTDASSEILEISGLGPDDEEVDAFRPYHVFARHERSLWLANLQTQAVALAFDFDVDSLTIDLNETIIQMLHHRFKPGWHHAFSV